MAALPKVWVLSGTKVGGNGQLTSQCPRLALRNQAVGVQLAEPLPKSSAWRIVDQLRLLQIQSVGQRETSRRAFKG
jgi:hypothetical protein